MQRATPENKDFLTPEEAIDLFALSRIKFGKWLQKTDSPSLVAHYGKRKLVDRIAFEEYLKGHPELRRRGSWA